VSTRLSPNWWAQSSYTEVGSSTALNGYRTAGDSHSVARIWEWKATQEEKHRQFEPAVEAYGSALAMYRIAGDTIAVMRIEQAISRTAPWGVLFDLKRGQAFSIRGDRVTVGRNSADIRNDISFDNSFISRRHLVISHEGFQAEDLRGINGTTVNANRLLPELGTKLADGDIISLANKEVLQFTTKRVPTLPSIPPSTWAIFIDGSSRSYSYLTEPVYSVGLTRAGELRIQSGDTGSALLKIRHGPRKSELFDASIEWSVVVVFKKNDYDYSQRILPRGQWSDFYDFPASLAKLSSDRKKILQQGPAFQIVTITD
jgi:FHA domain